MPDVSSRPCPRPGCTRAIVVASAGDLSSGAPLWWCTAGHRGPLLIGTPDEST